MKYKNQTVILSIFICILTITFWIKKWEFTTRLLPESLSGISITIQLVLVTVFITLIVMSGIRFKKVGIDSLIYPLIFGILILIINSNTLREVDIRNEFYYYFDIRQNIVNEIVKGKYDGYLQDETNIIKLTQDEAKASDIGVINVMKEGSYYKIFFYKDAFLDSFTGFAYIPSDLELHDADFGGNGFESKKINDNWYWCVTR